MREDKEQAREEMFDMGDKTPNRPPKKKKKVEKATVQPTIATGKVPVKKPKK